jgi:DEAD/DEAH box helicase domain-containing protein
VPSRKVNLRTISDHTYTIVDVLNNNALLGVVDGISAVELVYPEAIYLHEGETYFVRDLDMEQKVAYVEKQEVDYYTQPLIDSAIRIREEHKRKAWREAAVMFGDATVTWVTSAFKKVRFYNIDSIGYCKLGLPPQHLDTASMWLTPSKAHMDQIRKLGLNPVEGLVGIRNMCINVLPLHSMCDPRDVGGIVDSSNIGSPTMFLYDRYEGGLGFSERGYDMIQKLMEGCLEMVEGCDCDSGCPSCVGLPVLIPAQHQDPDVGSGYPIPSKEAARRLLELMLGKA